MRLPALGKLAFGLAAFWWAASAGYAEDWTMFQGGPGHTGQAQSTLGLPLTLAWKYATLTPIPGTNLSSPVVVGAGTPRGRVYFATKDRVWCSDLATGENKWFYPKEGSIGVTKPGTVRTTPVYADNILYVGATDGTLFALNAQTGDPVWQFAAKQPISGSPIVVNDRVYFGAEDGGLYALDAKTGSPVVRATAPLFQAADGIMGSIAYADGLIYFQGRDQYLYCLDPERLADLRPRQSPYRAVKWRYRLSAAPVYSSPVIYKEMVYIADGGDIVALTAARGRRRWRFPAESAIVNTPAVQDDGIYFGARDDNLYAVSLEGRLRWKQKMYAPSFASPVLVRAEGQEAAAAQPAETAAATAEAPAGPRTYVFVAGNRGMLYVFDSADGTLLWDYKTKTAEVGREQSTLYVNFAATPVVAAGAVYALSDDGVLLAFRADQSDYSPPLVTNENPARGTELSGQPPITFSVTVLDEGSGIDFNTVSLKLDGEELKGFKYDEYFGLVHYRLAATKAGEAVQPLKNGPHTVSLEAADWRGNKTTYTWQFMVNTGLSTKPGTIRTDTTLPY